MSHASCISFATFASRLHFFHNSALEWAPKLKASYFVDVRGGGGLDGDEKNASTSAGGKIIPQITTIAGMAADTRPFEEIKRMRLSQALESAPSEGTMLGLTPSPTYSASGMAHFDNSRVAPRFSPGKGVKVPGFNCRPSFSGGGVGVRDGGFGWQPLSPALTEPPTPPPRPDWKAPPDAAEASSPRVGGDGQVRRQPSTAESEQGVLPMEQRPLDEVDAVQALMSVGRGTRAQAEGMPVLEQAGDCGGQGAADNSEAVDMSEVRYFFFLFAYRVMETLQRAFFRFVADSWNDREHSIELESRGFSGCMGYPGFHVKTAHTLDYVS